MSKVSSKVIKAEITKIDDANDRITYYEFVLKNEDRFDMIPGQFLMLIMPGDPRPVRRAYSISSTPAEIKEGCVKLCITAVPGGKVSNWIRTHKVGDTVEFKAPYGKFVLPAEEAQPQELHFISVGTGIVPFRSMILDAFAKGCDKDVFLYHGNRHENSILYDDEFKAIAEKYSNFHYYPCISRPTEEWKGDTGYVQAKVRSTVTEKKDANFFICGMNAMIDDIRSILSEVGYSKEEVNYEKFD